MYKIISAIFALAVISFSSYGGVREAYVEVSGFIKKYDDKKIWLEKDKKKIVIPRLKEFEKRLKFTGEQRFIIDSELYSDFLKKQIRN